MRMLITVEFADAGTKWAAMRHCSGLMLCDCSTSYEDELRRVLYVAT
jgi:hypothetical protein